MRCNRFPSESYDLFALGILDDAEADEMRRHLRDTCADCTANVRESMGRMTEIALTTPSTQPPRAMRGRIISLVKPPAPVRFSWLRLVLPGTAIAACALAVGIGLGRLGSSRLRTGTPIAATPISGTPITVSRLSPPPVPVAPLPPGAPPRSETKPAPKQAVVVPTPSPDMSSEQTHSSERAQIASLETAMRAKDEQLDAARRELIRLQAPPSATPDRDMADYRSRIDRLTEQVELYKTALEQQRRELNHNVELVSLLSVPDLKLVNLAATEQGGLAIARALVTRRSAVFLATRLPDLQPGRSYQLWLMRRSAPAIVSGGVFRPDQSNGVTFEIKDAAALAGLTAMAVTEEPNGGSPLPTGHKILIGLAKS